MLRVVRVARRHLARRTRRRWDARGGSELCIPPPQPLKVDRPRTLQIDVLSRVGNDVEEAASIAADLMRAVSDADPSNRINLIRSVEVRTEPEIRFQALHIIEQLDNMTEVKDYLERLLKDNLEDVRRRALGLLLNTNDRAAIHKKPRRIKVAGLAKRELQGETTSRRDRVGKAF